LAANSFDEDNAYLVVVRQLLSTEVACKKQKTTKSVIR